MGNYKARLTEEQRKEILTRYLLDRSKNNMKSICNDYNITEQYVYKMLKQSRGEQAKKELLEAIKEEKNSILDTNNDIIQLDNTNTLDSSNTIDSNTLVNKKDINNSITSNVNGFSKRVESIIQLTLDRIEKELKEGDKITLSQLSTTLGILYDKSRLEQNLSTSNNSININIKVEK